MIGLEYLDSLIVFNARKHKAFRLLTIKPIE